MSGSINVVLLGDSTIDNGSYVRGGPDVAAQLKEVLEEFPLVGVDWSSSARNVKRLAVDGATTSTLERQLISVPENATHLVLSCGGNDALSQRYWADSTKVESVSQALVHLYKMQQDFAASYAAVVNALRQKFPRHPLLLVIPYEPFYGSGITDDLAIAKAGLSLFADVEVRTAAKHGCGLLDLRLVFDGPDGSDYANPIEPSVAGGLKLAGKIAEWVSRNPFTPSSSSSRGSVGSGGGGGGEVPAVISIKPQGGGGSSSAPSSSSSADAAAGAGQPPSSS